MHSTQTAKIPASWAYAAGQTNENSHVNGGTNGATDGFSTLPDSFLQDKAVRTVYGLVPLKYALDWPVFASYDELQACAAWMGGRLPTFEEARSVYAHVDGLKRQDVEKQLSQMVPAVNA